MAWARTRLSPRVLQLLFLGATLLAWDSKIHSGIIHASLMAIPAEDHIQERWGEEVWRLREYVQMADWINTLVSVREDWDTGGQTLEQPGLQFFANDYLLFPAAPHSFQHMAPDVKATYRPYFLRALQALRTESPANAARWTGSVLHFVTDSGSPPHAIGLSGPAHTKMESWLDTSVIDLSHYHPKLLGDTDEAAVTGLLARMDGLIAFSAIRANAMLPFVKVDDRVHMEPLAVESAAETARVAADVIHTLLKLTSTERGSAGGSLVAEVSAPAMDGMENLPAKLLVMETDYSTLSEAALPGFHTYRGVFSLRNIPAGTYRVAIERLGSQTLYIPAVAVKKGETVRASWKLQATPVAGNLAPNSDLTLRWLTHDAPDHWRLDAPRKQWVSDNIPVVAGRGYRAGCVLGGQAADSVELQWMSHAWEAMKGPTVAFDFSNGPRGDLAVTVPAGALFVRFVVKGQREPGSALGGVSLRAEAQ
jgi:hypothetical protein